MPVLSIRSTTSRSWSRSRRRARCCWLRMPANAVRSCTPWPPISASWPLIIWMAPVAVVGARNWITPAAEMEEGFFPQTEWIIDTLHERIFPCRPLADDPSGDERNFEAQSRWHLIEGQATRISLMKSALLHVDCFNPVKGFTQPPFRPGSALPIAGDRIPLDLVPSVTDHHPGQSHHFDWHDWR